MRAIKSREEKEKAKRRNQAIVGFVLVGIMLFSSLGYSFISSRGENKENNLKIIEYNGIKFEKIGMLWQFENYGQKFLTRYNPKQTENISIDFEVSLEDYNPKLLYFVSENSEAVKELAENLRPFIIRWQYACLEGEACEKDLPAKNCTENLIIIKDTDKTDIHKTDKCIFIEGEYKENIRTADALLFKILGISNN